MGNWHISHRYNSSKVRIKSAYPTDVKTEIILNRNELKTFIRNKKKPRLLNMMEVSKKHGSNLLFIDTIMNCHLPNSGNFTLNVLSMKVVWKRDNINFHLIGMRFVLYPTKIDFALYLEDKEEGLGPSFRGLRGGFGALIKRTKRRVRISHLED